MVTRWLPLLQASHVYPTTSKRTKRTYFSHALLDQGISPSRSLTILWTGLGPGLAAREAEMYMFFTSSCYGGRWALPAKKKTRQ